jgi:hypothetical protein
LILRVGHGTPAVVAAAAHLRGVDVYADELTPGDVDAVALGFFFSGV